MDAAQKSRDFHVRASQNKGVKPVWGVEVGRFGRRSLQPRVRFGVVGLVCARDVLSGSRGPGGRTFFHRRNFLLCGRPRDPRVVRDHFGRFGRRSLQPRVRFGVVGLVCARDLFLGSRGPGGRTFFHSRNFLRCGNFLLVGRIFLSKKDEIFEFWRQILPNLTKSTNFNL